MTSYLLAGPAVEPVSLAEAKAFLRLDDASEDAFVSTLIAAARLHIEGTTGRALGAQSWRVVRDDWPKDGVIALPVGPLLSLSAITAYDANGTSTSVPLAQFLPETSAMPARINLPDTLKGAPALRRRAAIEIDYVAGFGTTAANVPVDLKQAVLVLIGYWFEHRDAVVVAGSGAVVPGGFDNLIAKYRAVRL
jgi:uncharacterized phiE125 gp8 family phage protein